MHCGFSSSFPMAFLGSILRAKRGDFNLFLIAALVALLIVPGAASVALPPQSCQAMLFWLHSETAAVTETPTARTSSLLSFSHQKADSNAPGQHLDPLLSAATSHCGQFSRLSLRPPLSEPRLAPAPLPLERHAVAHLSGVRTNRRLN
jgi:hypothetical protein